MNANPSYSSAVCEEVGERGVRRRHGIGFDYCDSVTAGNNRDPSSSTASRGRPEQKLGLKSVTFLVFGGATFFDVPG